MGSIESIADKPALPRHPSDVTAAWLTQALRAAGLQVTVDEVRRGRLGEGVGMNDPEYADYRRRMQAHWDHLKVVVGEDIAIYEQLERTKRSSAYQTNILSSRECKLAHYHETMASMIKD